MEGLLIATRALHFAAAISLTGAFGFQCLIADPALRRSGSGAADARLRRRLNAIAWSSLALALVSGTGWLTAILASMSGQPLAAVLSHGVIWSVLTQTRFGHDWLTRLGLTALIALCLVLRDMRTARWLALGLAGALLANIAWAGHGAATPGTPGKLHLAGDILHLLGAGLWLGTLVPLELLLAEANRTDDAAWLLAARIAAQRFTRVAIASVTALLAGGIINTWFLAGTIPALVGTDYGRLLAAKVALFVAMVAVAAINRFRLTPRLVPDATLAPARHVLRRLRRNALIEIVLGAVIIAIVAKLGVTPPAFEQEAMRPGHHHDH